MLTAEEERELALRIIKGDKEAREAMIKANLRLVVKIARSYEFCGMPLLDLISEGNVGLMNGIDRFDPKHGVRISTYVSWWIKQGIRHGISKQAKTIRLPAHILDKILKLSKAERSLSESLGREPTDAELAAELETTESKIGRLREASTVPSSLDTPIGDGNERLGDLLPDDTIINPGQANSRNSDIEIMQELLGQLDERERAIIAYRYGFDGGKPRTLEQVGKKFRITRERIRQIQHNVVTKLRQRMRRYEYMGRDGKIATAHVT